MVRRQKEQIWIYYCNNSDNNKNHNHNHRNRPTVAQKTNEITTIAHLSEPYDEESDEDESDKFFAVEL